MSGSEVGYIGLGNIGEVTQLETLGQQCAGTFCGQFGVLTGTHCDRDLSQVS